MSRGTFVHWVCLSLLACAALAGCASTEKAAPIVDRTAVRTETQPVERRASDTSASQSGNQSTKTRASSDGAAKSSNKNTGSETPSSNRNAQTRTTSDSTGQSPDSQTNTTKRPAKSAKQPASRQNSQSVSKPYRAGDWRPEYHTVRKGDTLYSIALDFGQDYRDLARWNALADPSYIQIGQQLRLFPKGGRGADPLAASAKVGKPLPGGSTDTDVF